jgi:uncharacterized protein
LNLLPLDGSFASLGFVLGAALAAGFVDAIVGGGGLIQLPALLAGYPAVAPPVLLGTNKLGSICGTLSATLRYMRAVTLPWRSLLPSILVAFLSALAGARLVSLVHPSLFRPLIPVMLTSVLAYVIWNKDLGNRHAPLLLSRRRRAIAILGVAVIGMYDGFFGPGTGSFLMLLFIRLYGFDYLHASAAARTINVSTNAGALLLFGLHGQLFLALGLAMGACNAAGSILGTYAAVRHGSKFVRVFYIAVVIILIAKTAADAAYH